MQPASRTWPTAARVCVAAALFAAGARADDLQQTLALPLSAGSVALLIEHPGEPAAHARWAEALKDARPDVRTAAARVVVIAGARDLLGAVEVALAAEQDEHAAEEQTLALATLGGTTFDAVLLHAAGRWKRGVTSTLALAWARTRGAGALTSLEQLRSAGLGHRELERFLVVATDNGRQGLPVAATRALETRDLGLWRGVTNVARRSSVALGPDLLTAALISDAETLRAVTYRHLAVLLGQGREQPPAVREALQKALDAEASQDPGTRLAVELAQRVLGRAPVERGDWIASHTVGERRLEGEALADEPQLLYLLTSDERASFGRALRGNAHAFDIPQRVPTLAAAALGGAAPKNPTPHEVIRSVTGFPPGLVASLLEAAGCRPSAARGFVAAAVSYRTDGRPQNVVVMVPKPGAKPFGKPPECERAAQVLLSIGMSPKPEPVDPAQQDTVLAFLEGDGLGCLVDTPKTEAAPVAAGAQPTKIEEPKKIKNVDPVYPQAARAARVQGAVWLEGEISPTGCVRSLEFVDGKPMLTWAAMQAVSQWRYSPTRFDGVAVPVHMTFTINFSLN